MGRRKKSVKEDNPSSDWEVTYEMQVNGRHVGVGTELKIQGERGRYRFVKHVKTSDAEWIDVWGGPKHREQMRSFRSDKIARVHYKNTTQQALAQEYRDKKAAIKQEEAE